MFLYGVFHVRYTRLKLKWTQDDILSSLGSWPQVWECSPVALIFSAQFFETLSTCKLFLRIDVCGSWPVLRGIRWKLSLASHHSFPLVIELSFEKRQASLEGFFCGSDGKESASCAGDPGSVPG